MNIMNSFLLVATLAVSEERHDQADINSSSLTSILFLFSHWFCCLQHTVM